jgi:hypothetical protein
MENKMQLITKEIQKKLDKNFALSKEGKDTKPVLKLFTPWAGATWLISEIEDDGDTMFGLCDLGLGHVELGYISLKELKSLSGPFGLKVERDMYFSSDLTLQEWSDASDTKIAA